MTPTTDAGAVSWRALLAGTAQRLAGAGIASPQVEARRLVQEAAGRQATTFVLGLDQAASGAQRSRLEALVARRLAGEPLQYVLGRWGFRTLDLVVDPRVLIPRPETEVVAEHALAAVDAAQPPAIVVDLGTGGGALALAIAVERPEAEVWGVERSAGALAVAKANLDALGRAGRNVHLLRGSWYEPLPAELRGAVDVIVANPPYIADHEELPAEVAEQEPREALIAGPTGLEAITAVVAGAASWLAPGGTLVVEIGAGQREGATSLARSAGFGATVQPDLAGRDRVLVATRAEAPR